MKPGKQRPASSCCRIQGLARELYQENGLKTKTLGAQEMLRPRALLVPISSEPVGRIGLWIVLWARPKERAFTRPHARYREMALSHHL